MGQGGLEPSVPGPAPSEGRDDRAEALGHYTIPLKRDMKPTGVGRNLQICGDPGLCSHAVNMIYSKPFPDGTIKTRGSGFGSVSWSCWGAGRERRRQRGPGAWQGLHVPRGTPRWGQPNFEPRGRAGSEQGSCACPGDAQVPSVPPGMLGITVAPVAGSAWCVLCRVTLQSGALFQSSSGPAWKQACVSANERRWCCARGEGSSQQLPAREGCCPGHSSGRPGDGWGHMGGRRRSSGRRRSAALRVPHPGSRLAFSHTLGLLLYLSLIIRPVLRNSRLPSWQLLLIYPPRLRNARWHRSLRTGRAGDEGCPWPRGPGASAGLGHGIPGDVAASHWEPSAEQSHGSFSLQPLTGIAALGESKPEPRQCPQMWSCRN